MNRQVHGFWLALLVLVALAAPARAENPRVSLKVENATCAEAAAALARAANVSLQIVPPASGMQERASFDWTNTTFARALRQLCERFELSPVRRGGSYLLSGPGIRPGLPAQKPVFEKDGLRLFARRVEILEYQSRRVDFFEGQSNAGGQTRMSLWVGCLLADGDAEAIAGFTRVVARDDLGNLLAADPQEGNPFDNSLQGGSFPDECNGSVTLTAPPPRAKKLVSVEGDLMVYRVCRRLRVEIPLPLDHATARKEIAGATFEVTQFAAGLAAPTAAETGPSVQARINVPVDSPIRIDPGFGAMPALVGASGKTYAPNDGHSGWQNDRKGRQWTVDSRYAPIGEPVVKAIFQPMEKSDPVKLISFRMGEILLPPAGLLALPASPMAALPERRAGPEWPYYDPGGGSLLSRVQLGNQPAGEGTLRLGLSLKAGGEWGSAHWIDVSVDQDGAARVQDLKPGTYRLLRLYLAKKPPQFDGSGRWTGSETTIEVAVGRETTPPPLHWVVDPVEEKRVPAVGPARAREEYSAEEAAPPVEPRSAGNGAMRKWDDGVVGSSIRIPISWRAP
jgi:hypothetical protein